MPSWIASTRRRATRNGRTSWTGRHWPSAWTSSASRSSSRRTMSTAKSASVIRVLKRFLKNYLNYFFQIIKFFRKSPFSAGPRRWLSIWSVSSIWARPIRMRKRLKLRWFSIIKISTCPTCPVISRVTTMIWSGRFRLKNLFELIFLKLIFQHFGGISSGHYTAYASDPVDPRGANWTYFNDQSTSSQSPSERDAKSVYILFYRRYF